MNLFALVIAIALTYLITREIAAMRLDRRRSRAVAIVAAFAPGIAAARSDPRALLIWEPLARTVRQLCPDDFGWLDRTSGGTFPFSPETLQAAHDRWTADWLAWERTHDAAYKVKTAAAEEDLEASGGAQAARARLDAIEREKLDLYQRRYQDYLQVAKGLQLLISA